MTTTTMTIDNDEHMANTAIKMSSSFFDNHLLIITTMSHQSRMCMCLCWWLFFKKIIAIRHLNEFSTPHSLWNFLLFFVKQWWKKTINVFHLKKWLNLSLFITFTDEIKPQPVVNYSINQSMIKLPLKSFG